MALVRIEGLGVDTAVHISRPAVAGEMLRLRCTASEPRSGFYRLEEAADPGSNPASDPGARTAPAVDTARAQLAAEALRAGQHLM